MQINLDTEFQSLVTGNHYCFHHAVMRTLKGERFQIVVDDFGIFSHVSCIDCEREKEE